MGAAEGNTTSPSGAGFVAEKRAVWQEKTELHKLKHKLMQKNKLIWPEETKKNESHLN